jgi:hypothetical protein
MSYPNKEFFSEPLQSTIRSFLDEARHTAAQSSVPLTDESTHLESNQYLVLPPVLEQTVLGNFDTETLELQGEGQLTSGLIQGISEQSDRGFSVFYRRSGLRVVYFSLDKQDDRVTAQYDRTNMRPLKDGQVHMHNTRGRFTVYKGLTNIGLPGQEVHETRAQRVIGNHEITNHEWPYAMRTNVLNAIQTASRARRS